MGRCVSVFSQRDILIPPSLRPLALCRKQPSRTTATRTSSPAPRLWPGLGTPEPPPQRIFSPHPVRCVLTCVCVRCNIFLRPTFLLLCVPVFNPHTRIFCHSGSCLTKGGPGTHFLTQTERGFSVSRPVPHTTEHQEEETCVPHKHNPSIFFLPKRVIPLKILQTFTPTAKLCLKILRAT